MGSTSGKTNGAAREAAKALGSSGGKARAKNLSPQERTDIARKGGATRWNKAKGTEESGVTAKPVPTVKSSVIRSESVLVTPELARHLRDSCHFERQRDLSTRHISRLAAEMANGTFVEGTPITFAVYPDKTMAILNGNHTLEAVVKSGKPLVLSFIYNPVKDEAEAGRLYAQFDIQKTRSWGDAFRAYGFGEKIPQEWTAKFSAAIGILILGFASRKNEHLIRSRSVRADIMEAYQETAVKLLGAFKGANYETLKILKRRSVLAIALETMRYQPAKAGEFWTMVAKDDGLRIGQPARTLLQYLRANGAANSYSESGEQAKAIALAWNAFYTGRTLTQLKPGHVINFYLEGTPWVREGYDFMAESNTVEAPLPTTKRVAESASPSFSTGSRVGKNGTEFVTHFGQ